jgi:hypothetical protein
MLSFYEKILRRAIEWRYRLIGGVAAAFLLAVLFGVTAVGYLTFPEVSISLGPVVQPVLDAIKQFFGQAKPVLP